MFSGCFLPHPMKVSIVLEWNPTVFSPSTPGMSSTWHDRHELSSVFNRIVFLACLLWTKWQKVCLGSGKITNAVLYYGFMTILLLTWVFLTYKKKGIYGITGQAANSASSLKLKNSLQVAEKSGRLSIGVKLHSTSPSPSESHVSHWRNTKIGKRPRERYYLHDRKRGTFCIKHSRLDQLEGRVDSQHTKK